MSPFVVSGPGGGSANRLEINAFIKNDRYFSLYIQALQLMYTKEPQTAAQSFFQIGGIHGLPFAPWDGVTVDPPVDLNRPWVGYCTHGTVLFPTWHRLYVSLFEQILWNHAQDVAATYTVDQAAWKAAATTLRQPYWDWAVNPVPPAEVISLLQVNITGPDGKRKPVDNPLYHYKFHPIHPSFFGRYAGMPTTLRQPTSDSPNATDDIARVKAILTNAKSNTKSNLYNMLTRITTWAAFSNHSIGDAGSLSNSLEGIHNNIHIFVGGHGHFGQPAVAAFDPIFFLHHSNVDRILSLWGALNPGVWVSEGDSKRGTFAIPAGVGVDTNTDLKPFYNTQTTFWASADAIDTSKLGYTYPEFNGLATSNPAAIKKAIVAIVNKLYGSEIFSVFPPSPEGAICSIAPQALAAAENNHPTFQQAPAAQGYFWDWTARIEFEKFEVGTSFSVVIFLGQVPENPKDYFLSPNFVGAYAAFVNSVSSRCQNCQNQVDLVQEGFVHLSRGILEHGQLRSLNADVVEPYLTRELHWRVVEADSRATEIPSLEVSVFSTPLSYPNGSAFPVAGDSRRHNGITYGRHGGSRQVP